MRHCSVGGFTDVLNTSNVIVIYRIKYLSFLARCCYSSVIRRLFVFVDGSCVIIFKQTQTLVHLNIDSFMTFHTLHW